MVKVRSCSFWRALGILIFGVWLSMAPRIVSAEKTDWKDKSYNFAQVKRALVYDADISAAGFKGSVKEKKYVQDYMNYAKKLGFEVLTYDDAWRKVSVAIGEDLDKIAASDRQRADALFGENLRKVADVWIVGRAIKWENDYYIAPERTVWERKRVDRSYRDKDGKWVDDYYYVTVPVTHPAHRVDRSKLDMTFEVCDAKTGKMIFGREDSREREEYDAQGGMYERICKSFFGDFGKVVNND